jgi:hypothetical protein
MVSPSCVAWFKDYRSLVPPDTHSIPGPNLPRHVLLLESGMARP